MLHACQVVASLMLQALTLCCCALCLCACEQSAIKRAHALKLASARRAPALTQRNERRGSRAAQASTRTRARRRGPPGVPAHAPPGEGARAGAIATGFGDSAPCGLVWWYAWLCRGSRVRLQTPDTAPRQGFPAVESAGTDRHFSCQPAPPLFAQRWARPCRTPAPMGSGPAGSLHGWARQRRSGLSLPLRVPRLLGLT